VNRRAATTNAGDESLGFFHDTRAGRLILSVLVTFIVALVVSWNLPEGEVSEDIEDVIDPVVNALGLSQSWSLFAPDPTTTSIEVTARLTFDDGTKQVFHFPDGEPLLGALREYRWRKFEGRLRLDDNEAMWRPTAEWIARESSTSERAVTRVVLVRTFSETPTPGTDEKRKWQSAAFYTFEPEASEDRP
jgi:hypothetical protein